MASRFWVGGTGTWDSSTTTHWAASTGGAGGQTVPGSADTVIFDGSSGGGTVTVNFGGTITVQTITCGAFTGTLDFSVNNNSVTLSGIGGFSYSGAGTRTIKMGSGTWTFTGAGTSLILGTTTTGLTFDGSAATLVFTATTASSRAINAASGVSWGAITVSANTGGGLFNFSNVGNASTIGTLSVSGPNCISVPNGVTTTVTNAMTINGSSGSEISFISSNLAVAATISSANNGTYTWFAARGITFTGGGTFSATSSFDLGMNTGITITAPASGGGGGLLVNPGMTGGIRG